MHIWTNTQLNCTCIKIPFCQFCTLFQIQQSYRSNEYNTEYNNNAPSINSDQRQQIRKTQALAVRGKKQATGQVSWLTFWWRLSPLRPPPPWRLQSPWPGWPPACLWELHGSDPTGTRVYRQYRLATWLPYTYVEVFAGIVSYEIVKKLAPWNFRSVPRSQTSCQQFFAFFPHECRPTREIHKNYPQWKFQRIYTVFI